MPKLLGGWGLENLTKGIAILSTHDQKIFT